MNLIKMACPCHFGLESVLKFEVTKIGGVHINSPADALPYIINLSVLGVPSQTIVNSLSEYGIYVSASLL